MIRIEYDIELPKNCFDCPLCDDEFNYCHGHIKENKAWELDDYQYTGKPDWCPLIEVKKEKEKLDYNMVKNRLSSKEISDFSPTGAKIY